MLAEPPSIHPQEWVALATIRRAWISVELPLSPTWVTPLHLQTLLDSAYCERPMRVEGDESEALFRTQ